MGGCYGWTDGIPGLATVPVSGTDRIDEAPGGKGRDHSLIPMGAVRYKRAVLRQRNTFSGYQ